MNEPTVNGLTKAQWLALYEEAGWQKDVMQACFDVASCVDAQPMDRENAMAITSMLIGRGVFAESDWPGKKSFAEGIRDVQLSIVRGNLSPPNAAIRQACAERMDGVRLVVHSVMTFSENSLLTDMAQKLAGLVQAPPTESQN